MIDKSISPVAEANVYLAYAQWDPAIDALERGLEFRDHEFAMAGVERPRDVVQDLLRRMKQAATNYA
ncbi:hypothetical protein [Duganella vulcania]|uniref:Uncharacterized protein n=1 Tax=Duganella vulcania TaxID=2692166 RepID=A0A845GCP2_9BURK|nr:hypothetical protein [Duganella vulcania]MYM92383.1 hypothetical protein [Duganella vulcania]